MTGLTEYRSMLEERGARFGEDGRPLDFGDPAGELAAIEAAEPVIIPLDHRSLLTATGTEVLPFFQGQFTNDVNSARNGQPVLAAHLTPKGRVLATLLLFPLEDGYAVDFPGDTAESLTRRLRMFVLRSDVHLEEAGGHWIRLGLAGPGSETAAAAAAGSDRPGDERVTRGSRGTVVPLPGPGPAFMVLVPTGEGPAAWREATRHARPVGDPAWTLGRIRAGVPDLGAAHAEQFLPQEANLEPLGAISYTKGCYTGQEVVARTKHLGRLKRRLYRVAAGAELHPGQAVQATEGDQAQGRIVSAAPAPGGGWEALAVLRIETVEAGTPLFPEGQPESALEVLALPYSPE